MKSFPEKASHNIILEFGQGIHVCNCIYHIYIYIYMCVCCIYVRFAEMIGVLGDVEDL